MLLGSSWWALVRRWHRRDYRGRSGFFREVSWEWCPESASYEKQICVMCPLVDWNSFLFELTVQCWQCPPPVRWCRPWACTRRALAVCHLGLMLGRAEIGMLKFYKLKRKPVAGYIKIPPYFNVRWTSATIEPMYLRKGKRYKKENKNLVWKGIGGPKRTHIVSINQIQFFTALQREQSRSCW